MLELNNQASFIRESELNGERADETKPSNDGNVSMTLNESNDFEYGDGMPISSILLAKMQIQCLMVFFDIIYMKSLLILILLREKVDLSTQQN